MPAYDKKCVAQDDWHRLLKLMKLDVRSMILPVEHLWSLGLVGLSRSRGMQPTEPCR
jgi:hypothetical protein